MSLEPRSSDGPQRRSILQGVYEDNLRIDRTPQPKPRRARPTSPAADEERPPPATRQAAARRAPWKSTVAIAAALCLVLALSVAAAAYWQGRVSESGGLTAGSESSGATPAAAGPAGTASRQASALAAGGALADSLALLGAGRSDSAAARASVPPVPSVAGAPLTTAGGTSFSVAQLFGLEVRTIVIDPGHGGEELGAVGPGGTHEKEVVLDVARRLRRRLEQREGYRILMTREWDEDVPLKERAAFANRHDADLFVSIHVNSLPVERVTSIETYYFGAPADGPSLRMARRENAASDYTLAEFNDALDNTRNALRLQESRRLAASIQRNLYRNMRTINRSVNNWGVKTAPFVVLMETEAPSVLAEIAVITNRAEEAQLSSAAHRENLAMFLEQGIVDYLNGEAPNAYTSAPPSSSAE